MALEAVGWNARWQQKFAAYAADDLFPARVVGEHRSHYRVATELGELTAEATGRIRKAAVLRSDLPGVGDFVAVRPAAGDGPAIIDVVLPRTGALIRKASGKTSPQLLAANIDIAFIVTAMDSDFNVERLRRYLELVNESGALPVIVLNNSDLAKDDFGETAIATIAAGIAVHAISARSGRGVFDFDSNRTIGLFGSSGVGKSTLTNHLLGRSAQPTQEVRPHDNRGRHTTTHRQLFVRPQGGAIIDTPGMRGLELWGTSSSVEDTFSDITVLAMQCRFSNCRHESEPGCAVKAAVNEGRLDDDRLSNYSRLASGPQNRGR